MSSTFQLDDVPNIEDFAYEKTSVSIHLCKIISFYITFYLFSCFLKFMIVIYFRCVISSSNLNIGYLEEISNEPRFIDPMRGLTSSSGCLPL